MDQEYGDYQQLEDGRHCFDGAYCSAKPPGPATSKWFRRKRSQSNLGRTRTIVRIQAILSPWGEIFVSVSYCKQKPIGSPVECQYDENCMVCCGGRPCGGVSGNPEDELMQRARWPKPSLTPTNWREAHQMPQFEGYDDGLHISADDEPFSYSGEHLRACHFPLGGFGTGRVLLCGDGTLQDWTLLNQCRSDDGGPGDQGGQPLDCMPANFFAVSCGAGVQRQAVALISPQNYTSETTQLPRRAPARVSPHSVHRMQTIPGIRALTMRCRYPIADVQYNVPGLPVELSMEAMNPTIPGDAESSSIPMASFAFTIHNPGATAVTVSVMQAQQNFIGWDGLADCTAGTWPQWGGNVNTPFSDGGTAGLVMSSRAVTPNTADIAGEVVVAAAADQGATIEVIPQALNEEGLFDAFASGKMQPVTSPPTQPSAAGKSWCGGVVQTVDVPAGETRVIQFYLAWYFPNRSLKRTVGDPEYKIFPTLPSKLGNHYNNSFVSARDVLEQAHGKIKYLQATTRAYVDTLYGSTIPASILESAGGRLAVMRSPTMCWSEANIVLGTEGNGCCPLNCSHVYGYTTLLERLFPSLAQDMAITNFVRTYNPALGGVTMRYGTQWAIDGTLASVIKAYICVRQSDSGLVFLRQVWDNVKAQMKFILEEFDDGTGVIRCAQEDTYDTYMEGANTFIGSYYVAALKASACMARLMGDETSGMVFDDRAAFAATNYEKECWNEKFGYYIGAPLGGTYPPCPIAPAGASYGNRTYGSQCFIDQICAIGLSSAAGLGHIFDPAHEATARQAIFKFNTIGPQEGVKPIAAHFYTGDSGMVVCSNPHKVQDGNPNDYTLVSSGFESPVIAGMILDRNLDDAISALKNLRHRCDGRNRSPWNEPECGQLYSRAMAHWNLYDQACGTTYDSTKAALAFDPRFWDTCEGQQTFKCLYLVEAGWGQFSQTGPAGLSSGTLSLKVLWGITALSSLHVVSSATSVSVTVGSEDVPATITKGVVTFNGVHTFHAGQTVEIRLTGGSVIVSGLCKPSWTQEEQCCLGQQNERHWLLQALAVFLLAMLSFLLGSVFGFHCS